MEQQHFRVTAPLSYRVVGYAVLVLRCCFSIVHEHCPWDRTIDDRLAGVIMQTDGIAVRVM